MTLQAQEIEIPLNLGMATKPSEELQEPSSMRLVQNLHWRGQGEIERKPALNASVTVDGPSGSSYDEDLACGLFVRGDDPVVVTGRHGVMTYSERIATAQWVRSPVASSSSPGTVLRYSPVNYEVSRRFVERTQFNKESKGIFSLTSAQYSGVHVLAWFELAATANLLRLKAVDADTGAVLATGEYVTISNNTFVAQACEYTESGKEGVLVAYVDAAATPYTVKTVRYNYATNQFVADSDLSTDVGGAFTIVKNGTRIYFGYHKNTGSILTVEDRTISTISTTHTGAHSALTGVSIVKGDTYTLITSCSATTAYAEVFGTPAGYITALSASSETFFGITMALETRVSAAHNAVAWVNCATSTAPTSRRVRSVELYVSAGAPVAADTAVLPHCQVVTNAFTLRGHAHVVVTAMTSVQGILAATATSCFVARYRCDPAAGGKSRHDAVAKICHDRYFVGGAATVDLTQSAYVDSSNNVWIGLTADPPEDLVATYKYPQTIFLQRVSAARPMPMPYTRTDKGVVLVAGGLPWEYDGDTASECAALVRPLLVFDVASGTGQTGTFSAVPVYRWVDAAGRLHRMAGTAVSTGSIANKQIDVYISRCPLRAYDGTTLADLEPELYITNGTDAAHYLANDASGNKLYYSSVTGDGLWYKFTAVVPADVSNLTQAIFTTETPPEPTPAFHHVATIGDRVWAVDAEERGRIWFSKPLLAGFAPEWSTTCTLFVADEACAVVDVAGTPTVLARGGLYQIAGPGPDENGTGSFSPAQKLPFEVDCIDPVSVCRTPLGVVFRGRRGLYALADAPRAEPGALIDPEMLTDPSLDPSPSSSYRLRVVYQEQTNEIHCVTPSGDRLVYNVLEQKWSKYTDTSYEVLDLAVARGRLWVLRRFADTSDILQSEKTYAADGVTYNEAAGDGWRVDTPWYRMDQVAGMVRLWRVWVALKLPSDPADSSVSITYYTNWNESSSQTVTWSGSELSALYNSGAGDVVVRLPFVPNVQACTSFKFKITCTPSASTSAPKPLALRLQVGARPSKSKQTKATLKG